MKTTTKGFHRQPAIRPFVATWWNEVADTYSVGTVEARTLEAAAGYAAEYGQGLGLLLCRCVDPQNGTCLTMQEGE
jgi:hypothetical protein